MSTALRTGKMPAFQFYPGDWLRDLGVRALSRHDRSVWFDLLCMMHESERRGLLLLNGKPMTDPAIANALSMSHRRWDHIRDSLIELGVASVHEETGALMSRRMVRDEERLQQLRENGTGGGRPPKQQETSDRGKPKPTLVPNLGQEANQTGNQGGGQNETTSASSSPSGEKQEDIRRDAAEVAALVPQIVLAHPWAKRRHWKTGDIPQSALQAVHAAITADSEQNGVDRATAAAVVLSCTRGYTDLPDDRVRFVTKDVAEWFRRREYRADPALTGNQTRNQNGTKSGGKDAVIEPDRQGSSRGAQRVQDALNELRKAGVEGADGRTDETPPKVQPASWRGDECGVPPVVLQGTG